VDLPIEITSQYSKLSELCNKYKVVKLFVFGSAATGNFNSNKSDIDLIVELDEENPVRRGESIIKPTHTRLA
jgi:predicted nucleotidyltransferase